MYRGPADAGTVDALGDSRRKSSRSISDRPRRSTDHAATRTNFNASVGDNGGPYDLHDYARGYFDATQLLLKSVGRTGSVNDLLVYPICLNFRHAVELFIKYLISDLTKLTRSNAKFRPSHLLEGNWSTAMNLIKLTKLDVDPDEIKLITRIVTDIMEVDPNGNIFRYPESIKGDQHLKDWAIVNLAVVNDVFSLLFKVVEDWHFKIEGRIEAANEQAACKYLIFLLQLMVSSDEISARLSAIESPIGF